MNRLIYSLIIVLVACHSSQAQLISDKNVALVAIDDVDVASLDPGVISRRLVQPGDEVQVGDLLIELDADIYAAEAHANELSWLIAREEAKNEVNLRFSQKTLALNEKQLEKSLAATRQFAKSVSEAEIDRLKLERDQSLLSIEQAQLERATAALTVRLREAQKMVSDIRLQRRKILAPLTGIVVEVSAQRGEAVTSGQPVLRIVNLDRLRIKAVIDSKHVFQVNKKSVAYFETTVDNERLKIPAKIVFVNPELKATQQAVDVWADIDNSDRKLLPGNKGDLMIELAADR